MKFSGEITVPAPREAVFDRISDARFFASCMEGVRDLQERGPDRYAAVLETRVAYLRFTFQVTVERTQSERPRLIEGKIEGAPHGMVGRLIANAVTRLDETSEGTRIAYEVDAALTGKLGSLGQPVLRAKSKEMERVFAERLRAAFAPAEAAAR